MSDLDAIDYCHWARNIRGLADTTIRVRLDLLDRLHAYIGIALRDAEPGHLLRFERAAIAGRAPETRRAYVCHLRAFYRWAKTTGIVTEDPSQMLTLPKVPRHLPRPIEEDDLNFALAAARPKMRAILTLAAYGGLRCVEIAGLDWSDLRREQDGTVFIHVRHGKGQKERAVEVGQVVLRALHGYGVRRKGPMFYGADGRPIDAKSISRSGNRFLARHGLEATMHQLRHRYGTVAYELSQDLRLVQELLGHASPTTTAGYTRTSAAAAGRMVAAMDAIGLPEQRTPGLDPAGSAPNAPSTGHMV
jgi:integrase/recombinase XerC